MLGINRKTALLGSASAVALLVASGPAAAQTQVEVSGYVKLDFIYDFDQDVGDSFTSSSIPLDGSFAESRDGHARLHAKQSRLRFKTKTPTDMGDMTTHLEGDFLGAGGNQDFSNSNGFRLRHAYGTLGPFLAGQTWTNFMTLHAYPWTVDFFGPAGIPFIRAGQVRYTFDAGSNTKVSVSLENPELSGFNTVTGAALQEARGGIGLDEAPDLTARAQWSSGGNTVSVSGVLRHLEVDNGVPGAAGIDDDDTGWGVHVAGTFATFGDDTINGTFTYSDGAGRYIINGFGQDAALTFNPVTGAASLDTIESWGLTLSYHHYWNQKAHSTVAWGHYEVEDTFVVGQTEELNTVHVNYQWHPVPNTTFGLEWIYGEREVANPGNVLVDDSGEVNRVQFGAQFAF